MKPKVSVIVPVYNVREYLRQCVDSVINQSYRDLEIILVDDGSTDDSGMMCDEYARNDDRITVIHKPNGGLSDARNAGIEVATGKYIYFLDGDDSITPDALGNLVQFAECRGCDVVQGGFWYDYGDYMLYDDRRIKDTAEPFVLDTRQAMLELIKNEYVKNFAWGKLYKRVIVKRYPFKVGVYFEDSYWQHLVMHDTTVYGVVPQPSYYYRQRSGSISGTYSTRNLDLLKGTEEKFLFIRENHKDLVNFMAESFWNLVCDSTMLAYRIGDAGLADAFRSFRHRVEREYRQDFDRAMSGSLRYRLAGSDRLLRGYDFIRRVYDRLFGKSLKRIDC